MPKASPAVRSFNAGIFSELVEGRTDIDRYPSSVRSMHNTIAAPQGPAISRSGTTFVVPTNQSDEYSRLIDFVFSNEQAQVLEFGSDRIRFIDENGIQVYSSITATTLSLAGALMQIQCTGMGAAVGDQIALSGFPDSYNINGCIANVTAKSADDYTLDVTYPASVAVVNGVGARVYHVPCVYTQAERKAIRTVQSVDVIYLMTPAVKSRKLSRYGNFDWRLEDVTFVDGPYLPVNTTDTSMTLSATGNAVPDMTSNTLPSGLCTGSSKRGAINGTRATPVVFLQRDIGYSLPATDYFHAFDASNDTYWAANTEQSGTLQYDPASPFVCDGYTIFSARDNQDTNYLSADYTPSSFSFEGYTGSAWVVLDRRETFVLYENNKSEFIKVANDVSYTKYRLVITELSRNGLIEPRIRRLTMRSAASSTVTLTASAITGINSDTGFQTTDVGRLIRLRGSDASWRECVITARTSTTSITVDILGEPFLSTEPITEWRLGYWSDTTGWPRTAEFSGDRLWYFGPSSYPDQFAGSVVGAYNEMSQTTGFGEVLDDSAIVGTLNARKLSNIRWAIENDKGLVMGTGSEEYIIAPASSTDELTARNAKAKRITRRGSADVQPILVDNQILHVQRSGRGLRELAFVFQADGFKSPSMSQLASNLGSVPFDEIEYAQEPHGIAWVRRTDGSLIGLTYNRDENVVGWHTHDFSGGMVESLAVIPQEDQLQDALWVVIKRTINGNVVRYIERLTRFWDFTTTINDAHFVDCALRYSGSPVTTLYGLKHLEGEVLYGLGDLLPIGPLTVVNGSVTLNVEASEVILGLGYESYVEIQRLENGAADGTAQGKTKRMHNATLLLWNSVGGEIGVRNENTDTVEYTDLEYPNDLDQISDPALYSGFSGPIILPKGYGQDGTVFFRRPKESPLPFNVVAILPQMNTQDR